MEAEQSVLGGLLLDDDTSERTQKVLSLLKPESFYSRQHQVIFAEMRQMYRDHKPVDLLTLFDALESKGLTKTVGGFAYLAEMSKNTPSAANIVAYAMRVRETAMERYGIEKTTKAIELLYARNGMTAEQKFDGERFALGANIAELLVWLGEREAQKVVVLASGDPLFYGIGTRLIAHFGIERVRIIPGISAVQYLCAKAGIDMNDIWLTSSHGRDVCFDELARQRKVAMVTDGRCGPREIAAQQAARGKG
ncbi:precorrin-6y C5,15-methyltransferase (decarboxylating) subunit CbiE, partial [Klebsiella michiganensis]